MDNRKYRFSHPFFIFLCMFFVSSCRNRWTEFHSAEYGAWAYHHRSDKVVLRADSLPNCDWSYDRHTARIERDDNRRLVNRLSDEIGYVMQKYGTNDSLSGIGVVIKDCREDYIVETRWFLLSRENMIVPIASFNTNPSEFPVAIVLDKSVRDFDTIYFVNPDNYGFIRIPSAELEMNTIYTVTLQEPFWDVYAGTTEFRGSLEFLYESMSENASLTIRLFNGSVDTLVLTRTVTKKIRKLPDWARTYRKSVKNWYLCD